MQAAANQKNPSGQAAIDSLDPDFLKNLAEKAASADRLQAELRKCRADKRKAEKAADELYGKYLAVAEELLLEWGCVLNVYPDFTGAIYGPYCDSMIADADDCELCIERWARASTKDECGKRAGGIE